MKLPRVSLATYTSALHENLRYIIATYRYVDTDITPAKPLRRGSTIIPYNLIGNCVGNTVQERSVEEQFFM